MVHSEREQTAVAIHLKQFDPSSFRDDFETNLLIDLWKSLQVSAVDATSVLSVFEFQASDNCLYFATIHQKKVKQDDEDDPAGCSSVDLSSVTQDAGRAFRPYEYQYSTPPLNLARSIQTGARLSTDVGAGNSNINGHHPYVPAQETSIDEVELEGVLPPKDHLQFEQGSSSFPVSQWTLMQTTPVHQFPQQTQHSVDNNTSCLHPTTDIIGIIYLISSLSATSEASVGIALLPSAQGKGLGANAVSQAMALAFDTFAFHRVQAAILDGPSMYHAAKLFIKLGFSHEGVRRRAGLNPKDKIWKDVHYFGMVDLDWVAASHALVLGVGDKGKLRQPTLWDEMFNRHQREREELLGAEDKDRILHRTLSMETLRGAPTQVSECSDAEGADEQQQASHSTSAALKTSEERYQGPFISRTQDDSFNSRRSPKTLYGSESESDREHRPEVILRRQISMRNRQRRSSASSESDMESENESKAMLPSGSRSIIANTSSGNQNHGISASFNHLPIPFPNRHQYRPGAGLDTGYELSESGTDEPENSGSEDSSHPLMIDPAMYRRPRSYTMLEARELKRRRVSLAQDAESAVEYSGNTLVSPPFSREVVLADEPTSNTSLTEPDANSTVASSTEQPIDSNLCSDDDLEATWDMISTVSESDTSESSTTSGSLISRSASDSN